jgi:hypothetical protein
VRQGKGLRQPFARTIDRAETKDIDVARVFNRKEMFAPPLLSKTKLALGCSPRGFRLPAGRAVFA